MFRLFLKLLGLAAAIFVSWVLLVTLAPGSLIASGAPCPRNLGWGPAWLPRESPLEALEIPFRKGKGKLCYGSPSLKGRKMIGGDAVPYDRLWRLGANEPTTLHLSRIVYIGDLVLAPGSYSLYAVPGIKEWEIVINSNSRQWGLESEYTDEVAEREVGRIRVQTQALDIPVEKLTFTSQLSALGAVELVFEWQTTRWRLPLVTERTDYEPSDEVNPVTDI
jgi:hypothetical protein